jgi:hypothetical protein
MIDRDNNSAASQFVWAHDGTTTGVGRLADLSETGNLRLRGTVTQNVAFDVAESFFKAEDVEAGSVVRIDPERRDAVRLARGESDPLAIGVVSSRPGFVLGGAAFDVVALRDTWGVSVHELFLKERDTLRQQALEHDAELRAKLRPAGGHEISTSVRAEAEAELESRELELFHLSHFAPVALAGRVEVKVDSQFGEIKTGDPLTSSPIPGVAMVANKRGPVIGTALEDFRTGSGKVLAFVHRSTYVPQPTDDIERLEQGLGQKEARIHALERRVTELNGQLEALQSRVLLTETQRAALEHRLSALESDMALGSRQARTVSLAGQFNNPGLSKRED